MTMTDHRLTSDTAVCLWIPQFALRMEERRRPDLSGRPTAILSPTDNRKIWQLSSLARHHGVSEGMTVSQAIGLCSVLTILEPDPVYYDEQFSSLLLTLGSISPVIEPVELGRVFIGVDGLERLVGGPERQLQRICRALTARRETLQPIMSWHGFRLGWACGKFASWVAATQAKPDNPVIIPPDEQHTYLRRQPIVVLPIDSDTCRRLLQLGVKKLGDLIDLPENAITAQFGREGRIAWQLAAGLIAEPVSGSPPPEPITVSIDFPHPVSDRVLLVNALDTLIRRGLRYPRRRGWRVHVTRVRALLEYGSSWLIECTLKDPSANGQHILAPLNTKLEHTPPTGAVERLTVEFSTLVRGTNELQLFARDATSTARAGRGRALRWAAREIQKRLKRSMLHHVVEVHPWSRIPERRYALIDYDP